MSLFTIAINRRHKLYPIRSFYLKFRVDIADLIPGKVTTHPRENT
jgi:hypothetical protein